MNKRFMISAGIILITVITISAWRAAFGSFDAPAPAPPAPAVANDIDSDGDGFSDRQEQAWGTNPKDARSFPQLGAQLLGQWAVAAPTGAVLADASGNGQAAQLAGKLLPQWDATEQALVFDGVQNSVQVPNAPALTPQQSFTLSTWLRVPAESEGLVAGKWPTAGKQGSYALAIEQRRLVLALSLNGQSWPLFGQRVVADDQWHFVVATCNGEELCLYVDGKLDVHTHTVGNIDELDVPLEIGLMQGRLSDVRLYDRALRHDEVLLLHELGTVEIVPKDTRLRRAVPQPAAVVQAPSPVNYPFALRAAATVAERMAAR